VPCPRLASAMPFFSRPQHNTAERRPCCGLTLLSLLIKI